MPVSRPSFCLLTGMGFGFRADEQHAVFQPMRGSGRLREVPQAVPMPVVVHGDWEDDAMKGAGTDMSGTRF